VEWLEAKTKGEEGRKGGCNASGYGQIQIDCLDESRSAIRKARGGDGNQKGKNVTTLIFIAS
jgi:hypothetical protein